MLPSLWKREDGRDFWEGLFKTLKSYLFSNGAKDEKEKETKPTKDHYVPWENGR
jgi:hypothetical protein